jgi:hypothetical protein
MQGIWPGDRFGGAKELENLVSLLTDINLSQYKRIENIWAKAIKAGKKVQVQMDIVYNGNDPRPSGFIVNYKIDGEEFSIPLEN